MGSAIGIVAIAVIVSIMRQKSETPIEAKDRPVAEESKSWTVFGGTNSRNMVNLIEKNVPTEWDVAQKTNIKWVAKLGSRAYAGPTIGGGKIFVGTNNQSPRNLRDTDPKKLNPATKKPVPLDKANLMCFRESDGEFLWQHVNDKLAALLVQDWPHEGICSTPVLEGNRIWYVTNRCELLCLDVDGFANGNQGVEDEQYKDKTDADVVWRLDMIAKLNVFPHNLAVCSPLIVGDLIYIITSNGVDGDHRNVPAPNAPSFIAVNKNNGEVVWQDASPGKNIMHGQWSNPAYAEIRGVPQVIFPGGDGWIYSLEPKTGKLIWKFDANDKGAVYLLGGKGTKSDFISTPVVYDDKVYISLGQDPEHYEGVGRVWCIDPAGKTGDISPDLVEDAAATPIKTKKNPNSGAVWDYGWIKEDAETNREYPIGRTMSTPAIHEGILYIGEVAGFFHCIDAKTGKRLWLKDLKSELWGSAFYVDGKVYMGTSDGDVFIFEHGRTMKQVGRVEMDEAVRSTPVIVDGTLYIMTEQNLYAIQKK